MIVTNEKSLDFSSQKTDGARLAYMLILALSGLWLAFIAAPPVLFKSQYVISALIIHKSFSAICHQMPERSFHLFGFPLAVCARCTGIYLGAFIGVVCYPFIRNLSCFSFPSRRWLILALIPISIDFIGGVSGLLVNTHLSRALTGLMAGSVASFYLIPGLIEISYRLWPKKFK